MDVRSNMIGAMLMWSTRGARALRVVDLLLAAGFVGAASMSGEAWMWVAAGVSLATALVSPWQWAARLLRRAFVRRPL